MACEGWSCTPWGGHRLSTLPVADDKCSALLRSEAQGSVSYEHRGNSLPPQAIRILWGGVTQQNEIQLPPEANLVLRLLDATHTPHMRGTTTGSSASLPLISVFFIQPLPTTPPSRETRLSSQDSQSPWLIPQITSPARTPITVLVFTKGASCLAVPKAYTAPGA